MFVPLPDDNCTESFGFIVKYRYIVVGTYNFENIHVIISPTVYVLFDLLLVTLVIVGILVSIISDLLLPNELAAVRFGNVIFALFPTESCIVPPFNDKAPVDK